MRGLRYGSGDELVAVRRVVALAEIISLLVGGLAVAGWAGVAKAAGEPPAGQARFSGTFLQLDGGNAAWSAEEWDEEFRAMQQAGMSLVIVQWAATPAYVYYPSDSLPGHQPSPAPLDLIMAAAEKYGFSVLLGPYLDERWWSQYMREEFVAEQLAITARVAAELYARYGSSPAFAGWYLPYEINATPLFTTAGRRRAGELLRRATEVFHRLTPDRPVTIAPFFDRILPVGFCESWWKEVLTGSGVDTVFLQDGVGTDRGISPEIAGRYFAAFERATAAAGVKLWSDLEIFVQATWQPAPWERIEAQLQAEAPYVEGFVIFEFNHYMSPVRGGKAAELYAAYDRYIGGQK